MPIYRYTNDAIQPIASATFSDLGITERSDLQRLLRDQIEIIAPDTLVIFEEFGNWEGSRRRIDLLAIDRDANLVVIELKRTEDGGHMELQALRYAAMVSTLTFSQVVEIFGDYLRKRNDDRPPEQTILEFLRWDEVQEEDFATDVRIVLASAEFSREVTTAVLWLNDRNLDIRCVRIKPYGNPENTLLDVQQIIPLPEAEDYQVRVRERHQRERASRRASRNSTLTLAEHFATADDNGVGEFFRDLVARFQPLFAETTPQKHNVVFKSQLSGVQKHGFVISFYPAQGNEEDGIRFTTFPARIAEVFAIDESAVISALPPHKTWERREGLCYEGFVSEEHGFKTLVQKMQDSKASS